MITIGVDFSKRTSSYHVLDSLGQTLKRCKLENRPELIERFFNDLPKGETRQLTMEATRNWGLFYEAVKPHVHTFHLGHPLKMKVITESETKTDRHDAELIAKLTYSGFLPHAHVSVLGVRQLRSLLRFRFFLVRQRQAMRNQIQILLDRNLWPCQRPTSFKNILCKRAIQWLKRLELPSTESFLLKECLRSCQNLSAQIQELEGLIQLKACDLPGIRWLRTVPGFKKSAVYIYAVLLEADDIRRFRKAKHFAHYAGLVPKEYSSGDTHRTGRLVKQANLFLRSALIESTLSALRAEPGLRAYYQSVKKRAGSGAAIIASARKLCYAIYHVLKNQRAYYPFQILPVAA